MSPLPSPEEVAAAQARVRAKPESAELVEAPRDVTEGTGRLIRKGELAWRWLASTGVYGGPPTDSSVAIRAEHWTSRESGYDLGWEPRPQARPQVRNAYTEADVKHVLDQFELSLNGMTAVQWGKVQNALRAAWHRGSRHGFNNGVEAARAAIADLEVKP